MSEEAPFTELPATQKPHYHGDTLRGLFVMAAGLIFLAELLGGNLPFTTGAAVMFVITLVVAAGITNPKQVWIHWVNLLISIMGLMLFGATALSRFREDAPFSQSFIIGCLAVVFLIALYLATRTVRGFMIHD
jgi:hypothetical protein